MLNGKQTKCAQGLLPSSLVILLQTQLISVETIIEQFIESEPTAKFIRFMNNIFDVLNSKKKFDRDSKKPLSKENEHDFKLLFKANVDYLLGLKLSSGKKLVDTPRSRAFVGFVSLMKSIEYMFNSYVLTGHLEYLLTFKLSQDHLGLIFYII